MVWLIGTFLMSAYIGLVISVVLRMNQCRVLDKRFIQALLLPILHFVILPVFVLCCKNEIKLSERLSVLWFMGYMFPAILARFCARLAEKSQEVTTYNKPEKELWVYRGVYWAESQKRVLAC